MRRKVFYEEARSRHPERWAGKTKDWEFCDVEWLFPRHETEEKKKAKVS